MSALNTFPVSFKVSGKRILVVGGNIEALNKARLAVKTSAQVIVVASEFTADFSKLSVELVERAFITSDLDGVALLFVADRGPDGAAAIAAARAANIPVNAVDRPEECDFFTPAIVDRAPLSIAISTEGDSPVLSRVVRARIEAVLSPQLGRLAALAGNLRGRVADLLRNGTERRRFYDALANSPVVDAALNESDDAGHQAAIALLDQYSSTQGEEKGFVFLIGAGPGAEDLLTLRAQRVLQEADVIVHDQLVPDLVVQMGRRDADRIDVGKAKGHHSFSQAKINALLVRLAGEGKKVARLKSGDPMIFGRAGEELAALRKAGIAFSIIPGITAASAAAADSATPVTLRKVSSGLIVATAHGADNSELAHWAALAAQGMTLGIYMGKSIAGQIATQLIENGMAADTPVGIVVNAGRTDRALYTGSLRQMRDGDGWLADGPAIIFIGEAVARGEWADAVTLAEQQFKVA